MHYYAGGTFSKDNKDYAAEALKGNGFGVCLGDGEERKPFCDTLLTLEFVALGIPKSID